MILLYDGSFDGFLTAIYSAFHSKNRNVEIFDENTYVYNLLEHPVVVVTDAIQARKVTAAIAEKLGKEAFRMLVKVYLSEHEQAANIALSFLRVAFKFGPKAIEYEAHEQIGPFVKLSNSVSRELHRMIGLVRFAELRSGIFYGVYDSTFSLLLLLAPHFKERLGNQIWVLHDIKRETAVFYDRNEWHLGPLMSVAELDYSDEESALQGLWKRYHKEIAIEERKNKKLQSQMMPKKYWKYLTEMSGK